MKKISNIFLLACTFLFLSISTAYAKEMPKEMITDINKNWTIKFNKAIDFNTAKSGIKVSSEYNGLTLDPEIIKLDSRTVQVKAPLKGYEVGKKYKIIVFTSVKPSEGKGLREQVIKEFEVKKGFKAYADVEVSTVLPIFKSVNVKSTTFSEGKKYKIEGSSILYDVGVKNTIMLTDKPKITFYKEDGVTEVGKGIIDVSKTNFNVEINCQ